jgi:ribonuclease E
LDNRDDQAPATEGFDHVSSSALSGAPVNYVETSSAPVAAPAVTAPAAPAPAPVAAAVAAPAMTEPAAPAIEIAPIVTPPSVVEQVAAPAVAPVVAPVETAAPTPVSAPIVVPAVRADNATLHSIVQTAGLQWVESDPVRVAQAMANQRVVHVKLGREPKPRAIVSSEPLVQVETRR